MFQNNYTGTAGRTRIIFRFLQNYILVSILKIILHFNVQGGPKNNSDCIWSSFYIQVVANSTARCSKCTVCCDSLARVSVYVSFCLTFLRFLLRVIIKNKVCVKCCFPVRVRTTNFESNVMTTYAKLILWSLIRLLHIAYFATLMIFTLETLLSNELRSLFPY